MKSYPITLHPGKMVVSLPQGANLFEGLGQQGVYVYNACGGQTNCGKCKIRLTRDSLIPPPTSEERSCLTPQEIAEGIRLSCCVRVQGPMELEIIQPEMPLAVSAAKTCLPPISCQPAVRKSLISIPYPALEDNISYLERIESAIGSTFHPWYLLNNLDRIPSLLKSLPTEITAILIGHQVTLLEAGDTTAACYAVAIDIGTTMLDASLIELNQGREVAALSALNPQVAYGIDVLNRISSCQGNQSKVKNLQRLIIQQINCLLKQFASSLNISPQVIYQLAIAGNATMLHLFAGIDPRSIGRSPYVPTFSRGICFNPTDCGIEISSGGEIFLLPSISAYIGADIVAGMLSVGLAGAPQPAIFIDLGTNGEVALSEGQRLLATSCAAGPAMEGMNISCGMPALPGAIERIGFNQGIEFFAIGDLAPLGLCGSGVVDLAAEMIRCCVVDKQGRFRDREELLGGEHPWLTEHITELRGEPVLVLYQDQQRQIYFSQTDFRQLQLARGAICSAVEVLLTEAQLKMADIKRVIIAGRFGESIRMESFKNLGIIPVGFSGQLDYAGNSSLTGAMMALIDANYRQEAEKLCQRVNTIDLSTYPGYERILIKRLVL